MAKISQVLVMSTPTNNVLIDLYTVGASRRADVQLYYSNVHATSASDATIKLQKNWETAVTIMSTKSIAADTAPTATFNPTNLCLEWGDKIQVQSSLGDALSFVVTWKEELSQSAI